MKTGLSRLLADFPTCYARGETDKSKVKAIVQRVKEKRLKASVSLDKSWTGDEEATEFQAAK